jgi:hypothetical protein
LFSNNNNNNNNNMQALHILNLPQANVALTLQMQRNGYGKGRNTVAHARRIAATDCLLSCKQPNKKRADGSRKGWVKAKIQGTGIRKEYYLHHLSYMLANPARFADAFNENGKMILQVSHRCHNSLCFQSAHLCLETAEANLARNNCHPGNCSCKIPCIF